MPSLDAAVTDAATDDLHLRLDMTRSPRGIGGGWSLGVDANALAELLRRWRHDFDITAFAARVRALPWRDAGALRVVHQTATSAHAPTVVLLHGWPDSVLRFERVLPLLREVNVVAPALPGFPFAAEIETPITVASIADAVAEAMDDLGYAHYVVSGGDVGADIAEHLASRHPDRVAAVHLTNISPLHAVFADRCALTAEEQEYLEVVARWSRSEGAYIAAQSSKPHTLAVGLADSPAGLAAWLLEKLHGWADVAFDDDTLLEWISAYWVTNTIGSSFATYSAFVRPPAFVPAPTVLSTFSHDTKPAPLAFAKRFVNVRRHVEHDRGGHFAAWEVPDAFVADLRSAIALGNEATR